MNYSQLRELVITTRNVKETHNFLLARGLPADINMAEIANPLISLYTENATWKDIHKMLTILYVALVII